MHAFLFIFDFFRWRVRVFCFFGDVVYTYERVCVLIIARDKNFRGRRWRAFHTHAAGRVKIPRNSTWAPQLGTLTIQTIIL